VCFYRHSVSYLIYATNNTTYQDTRHITEKSNIAAYSVIHMSLYAGTLTVFNVPVHKSHSHVHSNYGFQIKLNYSNLLRIRWGAQRFPQMFEIISQLYSN
jgi:hypothetical protein